MKQKLLQFSKAIATLAFIAVFFGLAIVNTPSSTAVKATDFQAGRIIDDNVFYNANTMNVAQIQSFMDRTLPECDMWGTGKVGYGYYINGKAVDPNTTRKEYARRMREEVGDKRYHAPPYVCINKFYENPKTHVTNFDTNGEVKSGMISAAQIIYDAAKEFNINPQVLLVMLKKESYAWGDNWPTKNEYNTVMGYACPDNAACNTKYYGFYNQVNMAAWQLDYYKKNIYSYNYRPYVTNKIYYNPNTSCGSKKVYIENYATASLYIYTPYTPNDASLKNYPGTASCGSYGNRNFFMYFNEWFGSTLFTAKETSIENGNYYLYSKKDTTKYLKATERLSLINKSALSENAIFKIKKNTDNSYSITSYSGLVLDAGVAPEEGKAVAFDFANTASSAQKWIIYDSGSGSLSFAPVDNRTVALTYDETSGSFMLSTYTKAAWQKFGAEKYTTTSSGTTSTSSTNTGSSEPTVTIPEETTPNNGQVVENGTYSLISTLNGTSSLSLVGDKKDNNTGIHLWSINNKATQKYDIKYNASTDDYMLKNILSNKYLTAKTTSIKNGLATVIYSNKNDCSQRWKIVKNSNDTYTFLSACNGKYALDVSGGKSTNGTKIQLYTSNNTRSQRFILAKYEDAALNGQYYIRSGTNSNYAVDISGGGFANGKNIQLYRSNNSAAQKFTLKYISSCGCYNILTNNTNYSIDVKGGNTTNGTNVQIYKNNTTNSQRWFITKYSDGLYRLRSVNSRKMFNLNANAIGNGTNINIWQDGNSNSQKWQLDKIQ